jgi:uncharacterized protein YneF (UPF0154 family)
MRDTVFVPIALFACWIAGICIGVAIERQRVKREAQRVSEQRLQQLMRDIFTLPPSPRNAPLSFRAGNDSTAANLLIADAGGRAPRGEE